MYLLFSPSPAIYLAKKNIKRKGVLEEYEKVTRYSANLGKLLSVYLTSAGLPIPGVQFQIRYRYKMLSYS